MKKNINDNLALEAMENVSGGDAHMAIEQIGVKISQKRLAFDPASEELIGPNNMEINPEIIYAIRNRRGGSGFGLDTPIGGGTGGYGGLGTGGNNNNLA